MLPPCKCINQCILTVSQEARKEIHKSYWELKSGIDRNNFITSHVMKKGKERHRSGDNKKRIFTFVYYMTSIEGTQQKVCRTFFLQTLGYKSSNNKVILRALKNRNQFNFQSKLSERGKKRQNEAFQKQTQAILAHVESFHPTSSHYRRVHAPNRRYLPDELNLVLMHKDFIEKHESYQHVKYETYRKAFQGTNITICKLGHEECEECEKVNNHDPEHSKEKLKDGCDDCKKWSDHDQRAKDARDLYNLHADVASAEEDTVYYSVDMEKVIMIPRLETFKVALFTQRLSTYHETFAPLGSFRNKNRPIVGVIWHEAVAGRKQEQIVSTFDQFFKKFRDKKNIVLWLDNCAGQNKNW